MRVVALGVVLIFAVPLVVGTACADEYDTALDYAPVLVFESEEACFPVAVSYHVDNADLYAVDSGLIDADPTLESIAMYTTEGFYLDNQKGSVTDDGVISDYQQSALSEYTVYARVMSSAGVTVVQYWIFYAFNPGLQNQHEGDWELVQIVLSGGSPSEVMVSQHHSGQKATWDQVEKEGDHVKIYVSRGSHANYLRSYSGMIGLASDRVGAGGRELASSDYSVELLTNQSWLSYGGLWGWTGASHEEEVQASVLGQAGPLGPQFREEGLMWNSPVAWGQGLVPANDMLFLAEWFLYHFVLIVSVLTVLVLAVLFYRVYRRYKKTGLGPRVFSMLYIDGVNLKSMGNILCIVGILIALIALITPWYTVATDIQITGYETEGLVDMMTIDGMDGIQIHVPGLSGPIPVGSVVVPFSLLLGIGLVFLLIATIGVKTSKTLGKKYIYRGIRLLLPFLLIVGVLFVLGSIPFESFIPGDTTVDISSIVGSIAGSPFGGQQMVMIPGVSGQIQIQWGFALGGYLLLLSAVVLIGSGILQGMAHTEFFTSSQPKIVEKKKEPVEDNKKT